MNAELREFIQKSEEYLGSKEKTDDLKLDKEIITSKIESILKQDTTLNNYMLNGRVKKQDSLKEKIIRKPKLYDESKKNAKHFIDCILDDIIGIRIICLLNNNEQQIYNVLQSYFSKKTRIGETECFISDNQVTPFPCLAYSYEEQPVPQKNGKDIYKLKLKYFKSEDEFTNVELQIKSLTHMFWGELEHMLFYKNYKYTLDNEFYSKMMLSINSILETLDTQLKDIQSQLSKNDKIKDTKDMITKVLYNSIHDEIKKIYDTELDLREVYTLISQLYFYKHTKYTDALECSKSLLEIIVPMEVSGEYFNFSHIDILDNLQPNFKEYIDQFDDRHLFNDDTSETLNTLAKKVQDLTKGNDIFWGCLISIYIHLLSEKKQTIEENYTLAILNITYDLMKSFPLRYTKDVELVDFAENIVFINNIVLQTLNKCFMEYGKLDFFIESVHQDSINNIIEQFFKAHELTLDDINLAAPEELEEGEADIITKIISKTIEIQINYQLYGKLDLVELKNLKNIALQKDITLSWTPRIHTQNLENILEEETKIESLQQFQKCLYLKEETEDAL